MIDLSKKLRSKRYQAKYREKIKGQPKVRYIAPEVKSRKKVTKFLKFLKIEAEKHDFNYIDFLLTPSPEFDNMIPNDLLYQECGGIKQTYQAFKFLLERTKNVNQDQKRYKDQNTGTEEQRQDNGKEDEGIGCDLVCIGNCS